MLGKQVVFAHDTPNFIANRIGVAVMFTAATLMLEQGLTIEEVDALTGPAIGWPRTGTFRLADMVGIDILAHVAANFPARRDAGQVLGMFCEEIVKRGWLGDKSGQGFYKKARGADGKDERLGAGPRDASNTAPLAKAGAARARDGEERRHAAPSGCACCWPTIRPKTRPRAFFWPFLATLWNYAADRIGEVADDAPAIDAAMRAGFNWELGPV